MFIYIYTLGIICKYSLFFTTNHKSPENMVLALFIFFNGPKDQDSVPNVSNIVFVRKQVFHISQHVFYQSKTHEIRHTDWTSRIFFRFRCPHSFACAKQQ